MREKKAKLNTMDVILIIVAVLLIAFTVSMIVLYMTTGAIPDTLCTCVFATLGGECGVMGWIKTTKDRHTDRKWQLQDEERSKRNETYTEHNDE